MEKCKEIQCIGLDLVYIWPENWLAQPLWEALLYQRLFVSQASNDVREQILWRL